MNAPQFKRGDRVRCIDDKPQAGDSLREIPCVEGCTYTVDEVLDEAAPADRCRFGLRLKEIRTVGGRVGFCADRFVLAKARGQ